VHIQYNGPRADVVAGRHINSTSNPDDTVTIARPPHGPCLGPGCMEEQDHLSASDAARAGEVEISEAAFMDALDANDDLWIAHFTAAAVQQRADAAEIAELEPWREVEWPLNVEMHAGLVALTEAAIANDRKIATLEANKADRAAAR
jgi:hypothetical protein